VNVLILAAGGNNNKTNTEGYPICLTEFNGQPIIEILMQKWRDIDVNFGIMLRKSDIDMYHLDQVIHQITSKATVYPVSAPTAGAACTALMAVEQINTDESLVILNGDELLDIDYHQPLEHFETEGLDAGTVIFDSVHPRYSYVKLDSASRVLQAAEKMPISRNATAGFYWYRKGSDFVTAAMNYIRKHSLSEMPYFICPLLNEFILEQQSVGVFEIDKKHYKPFKSKEQIQHFQSVLEQIL